MTLREKLDKEIDELHHILDNIERATDYNYHHVKHGSGCDSGVYREKTIRLVIDAEKEFINEHKKEVLQRAAQNIRNYIGE